MGVIVVWLGFGERGFIRLYKMEQDRRAHLARIHEVQKENQELLEEIERVRTDKEYLKSLARKRLGSVKDDEILYRFSREEKDHQPSETAEK